ncbi:MAG: hypothetical protein KDI61_11645 [Alphaproteobacteria bacterium]|nr:hypothetical protein [Alphaproteobacteria bacterium]
MKNTATINIVPGIKFNIRNLTLESFEASVKQANDDVEAYLQDPFSAFPAPLIPFEYLNLKNEGVREDIWGRFLIYALADRHIVGWEGVLKEENGKELPMPVDFPNAKKMAVSNPKVAEVFFASLLETCLWLSQSHKDLIFNSKELGNGTKK